MKPLLPIAFLVVFIAGSLFSQDAKPEDENAVNSKRKTSAMMVDSPVVFPGKGALPAEFPPDLAVKMVSPEPYYSITESPPRSIAQINAIQSKMIKGKFTPPPTDWEHLSRTKKALSEGGDLHILGLGDSIINDTFRSGWIGKLAEEYPKADIEGKVYVRGGGACRHYWVEDRIPNNLVPLKPDLVCIGGISQQKNYEAIRSVIKQIRKDLSETEILLSTGVFGNVDPRRPDLLATAPHSGVSDYGRELKRIADELDCAFLDITTPWAEYIVSSGVHPHRFYRDRVHANEYGEQILSKILLSFFDVNR